MPAGHRGSLNFTRLSKPQQALLIPTQLRFEASALSCLGVPIACGQFCLEAVNVSALLYRRYEYALATHGIGMSSIEPDVTMHLYGSSQRHLFDTIQNIGKYDQLDTFDIIILNKVHPQVPCSREYNQGCGS